MLDTFQIEGISISLISQLLPDNKCSIALESNLVPQLCRWCCIVVFPGQSNSNRVLSCLLFNGPGNTVTEHPLANEIVPIKAAKDEYRPERY